MFSESDCIPSKIEKTVRLRIGDPSIEFNSGCTVIEASLPIPSSSKIGFIKFKNNYVASLAIRLKYRKDAEWVWKTVLKDLSLMPSAHHEYASQDYFVIDAENQFSSHPTNVVAVRFILRQPSPHWSNFGIEDLRFYLPPGKGSGKDDAENPQGRRFDVKEEQATVASPRSEKSIEFPDILNKFSKIVSMSTDKTVVNALKKSDTPSFDVDGSYDLNLLSYK